LSTETRTRLSLLSNVRCDLKDSSEFEHWMMKLTTKLRIPERLANRWKHINFNYAPWRCSCGKTFHLVMITLSSTCKPRSVKSQYQLCRTDCFMRHIHLVCGYVASWRILSTSSHASGSSLNCYHWLGQFIPRGDAAAAAAEVGGVAYLVESGLGGFLLQIRSIRNHSFMRSRLN
jgi:hypothetical protein